MDANSTVHDLKGSISLRAQETGSGFRFFFDDDEESYFDLNLEKMADSEEFEFQISFSPLPAAGFSAQYYPADELFRNGRILPMQAFQVAETRSFLVPNYGDQLVYPAERVLPAESLTPVDEAAGRANLKAQLDPGSENVQRSDGVRLCMDGKKHQGLTRTRKSSKVTAKKINNGVMKFLIKFPSEKIRSTFMSIVTSYHFLSLHPKRGQSSEAGTQERGRTYRRLVMQFSRWLAIRKRSSHNKSSKNSTDTTPQRPSDVDLDENIVRSILDAVDFAVGSPSRGAASGNVPRRSEYSSPRSTQKEIMEGAVERNSSINSAIAHCKMSYGKTARLP